MKKGLANEHLDRRGFLRLFGTAALIGAGSTALVGAATRAAAAVAPGGPPPAPAMDPATAPPPSAGIGAQGVSLLNVHTGERLTCDYRIDGELVPDALEAVDHLLRDYHTGAVKAIDPRLLDRLCFLAGKLGAAAPFHVVSGYRTAATNAMLRRRSREVARHSLHIEGRAVDFSVPGVDLRDLRRAALAQRAGGVGFYPGSGFVHLDTGKVRSW